MTSFISKSVQKKEEEKDVCSHRFRKEGRSCTLAKDKISGSIFLNSAVEWQVTQESNYKDRRICDEHTRDRR